MAEKEIRMIMERQFLEKHKQATGGYFLQPPVDRFQGFQGFSQ